MNNIAIKMENISKQFGSVIANKDIELTIKNGEIHALLGENGAGKSTLMNILSGIYAPDTGSIHINGEKVNITSPKHSLKLGIGMVHQHFKLIDNLTVTENIIAGQKGNIIINKKNEETKIRKLMDKYHLYVPLKNRINELSVGEKQTVEILKMLYRGAKILILDEPTAVLTPQEIKHLYKVLVNMKENGCAIIVITHKLYEVMNYCDKVTVLHHGRVVNSITTNDTNYQQLTEWMVGKKVDLEIQYNLEFVDHELLRLEQITVLDNNKIKILDQVSFKLHKGEILGVAGIAGSGQKELCEAIAGLQKIHSGAIYFEGKNISGLNPRQIIEKGINMSFIPEDRLQMGLVPKMSIVDNLLLKNYYKQKGLFINRDIFRKKADELVEKLSISTPDIDTPVSLLSGGNIQKVLLGREIDMNPKVLITAYAVRGLDINATYQIYQLLNEQKAKKCGILFIGEDLDVLLELCDRIVVLCDGKMTGIVNAKSISKEQLGLMMAGEVIEYDTFN